MDDAVKILLVVSLAEFLVIVLLTTILYWIIKTPQLAVKHQGVQQNADTKP